MDIEEYGDGDPEDADEGNNGNGDNGNAERSYYVRTGKSSEYKIIAPGTKVSSRGVMHFFGVSGNTKGSPVVKKISKIAFCHLDRIIKRKLTRRCFRIKMVKEAHAFLPNEPEKLVSQSFNGVNRSYVEMVEQQKCLSRCKKASLEKWFVHALLEVFIA